MEKKTSLSNYQHGLTKIESAKQFSMAPLIQESSLVNSNDSFLSGRSGGTNGGGSLANKISLAISRVVTSRNVNGPDDEEVADLISLLEELNSHSDLTVKLNNQSKICKILEANDKIYFANNTY